MSIQFTVGLQWANVKAIRHILIWPLAKFMSSLNFHLIRVRLGTFGYALLCDPVRFKHNLLDFLPLCVGFWGKMCKWSEAASPQPWVHWDMAGPPAAHSQLLGSWPGERCSLTLSEVFRFWRAFGPQAPWESEFGAQWRLYWHFVSVRVPVRWPSCAAWPLLSRWSLASAQWHASSQQRHSIHTFALSCCRFHCGSHHHLTLNLSPCKSNGTRESSAS